MHREYHPEDMPHHHAHDDAPGAGGVGAHSESHRPLFALTILLGLLIAADVLLGALGWSDWRAPLGVRLVRIAAVLGAARIVHGALQGLLASRLGADFALAQACVAALVLREDFVAAEVVFIAMLGEALEEITADRAFRSIGRLFERTPRKALVRRDGIETELPIGQVRVGDLVIVGPGEQVPVDGSVVSGRSSVDQSPLTGESIPIDKGPGEPVFAGAISQFGRLEVRAEKVGEATTLGQVVRLVREARNRKAPLERAADRYARWFLPVVQSVAALTLLVGYVRGWPDVWERAVAVLVVACPCALVLATPTAILAAMAWLARHGVVIKGGVALERLAECDTFAFDKTGTLTLGRPEVASIQTLGDWEESGVLRLAATAESASSHPLARAVVRAASQRGIEPWPVADATALPGAGVLSHCRPTLGQAEQQVLVGNARLFREHAVAIDEQGEAMLAPLDARGETPLLVAVEGQVAGVIGIRDTVRPEAHDVVRDLRKLKIGEIALLTGDRPSAASTVARRTHIQLVEAELLPADKASWIRERQESGRKVAMVGDGINDAPALATAHVGIALGGMGCDLAAEAGDMVILGDSLQELPDLVRLSRQTVAILRQNILGFAFGLNAVAMAAAFLGTLGPVAAAVLHQAGSLLVLLNAMRLLAFGDWANLPPVRAIRSLGAMVRGFDQRVDPGWILEWAAARWKAAALLTIVAGALAYATSGFIAIGPDEVGLLRRNGRYVGELGPGLHLRLPRPLESVVRLQPGRVRGLEVGFRSTRPDDRATAVRWESSHDRGVRVKSEDESLLMTGDGQLVELTLVAQYQLDQRPGSLRLYAFGAAEPEAALLDVTESVVRDLVAGRPIDELLSGRRGDLERLAAERIQGRVDAYGLGLKVVAIAFQDLHPPLPVVDAFRDVSRAESHLQTRTNQGEAHREEAIRRAEAEAEATVNSAEADRDGRVARAGGEADGFVALNEARREGPALTDQRLFHEMLARAFQGKDKLLLDSQKSARHHLILPDVPRGLDLPADRSLLPQGPREADAARSEPPSAPPAPSARSNSPGDGRSVP